jgi:hypothetical protein
MLRIAAVSLMLVALCGCVSTQSQFNADGMAGDISGLWRQQVLNNIARAKDDPDFVPSAFVLGQGQSSVTAGLTPTGKGTSINAPKPLVELDIAPNDSWTAQWQFTAVTNRDDLRNLRDAYALIVADADAYHHIHDILGDGCALGSARAANGACKKDASTPTPGSEATVQAATAAATATGSSLDPANPPTDAATATAAGAEKLSVGGQTANWEESTGMIEHGDSIGCQLYQAESPIPGDPIPFRRWLFWRKPLSRTWLPDLLPSDLIESIGVHGDWELGLAIEKKPEGEGIQVMHVGRSCLDDFIILVQGLTPAASASSAAAPRLPLSSP